MKNKNQSTHQNKKRQKKQSKRIKKQQKKSMPRKTTGLWLSDMPMFNPDIPKDVLAKELAIFGSQKEEVFRESIDELQKAILQSPPIPLLGMFLLQHVYFREHTDPEYKELHPIMQSHIEILHGLTLRYSQDEYSGHISSLSPENFDKVRQHLLTVHESFGLKRLQAMAQAQQGQLDLSLPALEAIRLHTQSVRNPGYPWQIERYIELVAKRVENHIYRLYDTSASGLIEFLVGIRDILGAKMDRFTKIARTVMQNDTIEGIINSYYAEFPKLQGTPDELIQLLKNNDSDIDTARFSISLHMSAMFSFQMTVTPTEISKARPNIDEPSASKLLSKWSLKFGDLKKINPEHLFMGNPVWAKPFIEIQNGRYMIIDATPHVSFPWEMMEVLFEKDRAAIKSYEDARAHFLEEEMSRIVEAAFPSGKHFRSVRWSPSSTKEVIYENDHVVSLGSVLIIFEAKSAGVRPTARRGARLTLQDILEELIISPSTQSYRLVEILSKNPNGYTFQLPNGTEITLKGKDYQLFVRINVSLEFLGTLGSRWPFLQDTGLVNSTVELCPSMPLADLEIVLDCLETEAHRAHYLWRRSGFERRHTYFGDELDLLVFYLDTGFNIADAEKVALHIESLSKTMDEHYLYRDIGGGHPKPVRKLTPWWRSGLLISERDPSPRAILSSMLLLNVAVIDQTRLWEQVRAQAKQIRKSKDEFPRNNIILINFGPADAKEALAIVLLRTRDVSRRHEWYRHALSMALDAAQLKLVVAIGVDVDDEDYPIRSVVLGSMNTQ